MTLALDERGLLPPGVHDATLEELKELFGRFQQSDARPVLFDRLRDYAEALKQACRGSSIIVDGSFVMQCVDKPEDIDLILVLPADWDLAADLKPFKYNLVSKKRVRQEYGIEIIPVLAGSVDEENWIAFFRQVNVKWCESFQWPDTTEKGIVRVLL